MKKLFIPLFLITNLFILSCALQREASSFELDFSEQVSNSLGLRQVYSSTDDVNLDGYALESTKEYPITITFSGDWKFKINKTLKVKEYISRSGPKKTIVDPITIKHAPANCRVKLNVDIDTLEGGVHLVGETVVEIRLWVKHRISINFEKASLGLAIPIEWEEGKTKQKIKVTKYEEDYTTRSLPEVEITKAKYPNNSVFYYPFVTNGNSYSYQANGKDDTDPDTYNGGNSLTGVGELYIKSASNDGYEIFSKVTQKSDELYRIKFTMDFNDESSSFINSLRNSNYHAGIDMANPNNLDEQLWFVYKTDNPSDIEKVIDFTQAKEDYFTSETTARDKIAESGEEDGSITLGNIYYYIGFEYEGNTYYLNVPDIGMCRVQVGQDDDSNFGKISLSN